MSGQGADARLRFAGAITILLPGSSPVPVDTWGWNGSVRPQSLAPVPTCVAFGDAVPRVLEQKRESGDGRWTFRAAAIGKRTRWPTSWIPPKWRPKRPPSRQESKRRDAPFPLEVDHSRDALLTDFGKDTLKDRYLLPGESYQDLFARVASAYADDADARPAASTTISRSCGSCRRRRCCRTAAPAAACRSPAI